jgi:hypothetical protein
VAAASRAQEALVADKGAFPKGVRLVRSCAGGMPPGVKTENLKAFLGEIGK